MWIERPLIMTVDVCGSVTGVMCFEEMLHCYTATRNNDTSVPQISGLRRTPAELEDMSDMLTIVDHSFPFSLCSNTYCPLRQDVGLVVWNASVEPVPRT